MITDRLPNHVPTDSIRVEEETHTFIVNGEGTVDETVKLEYVPNKSPVESVESVTGTVDGIEKEFSPGTHYSLVDTDNDGLIEKIRFIEDSDRLPDANTDISITYVAQPIIGRYTGSFDRDLNNVESNVEETVDSHQLNEATETELRELGAYFGDLGRQRSRRVADYRAYLRSLVPAFDGRGTIEGIKFAIAAGIGADKSDIRIEEDFTQRGYNVFVEDVDTNVITESINDMAQLADPAGVELLSEPVVSTSGEILRLVVVSESVTTSRDGLGSGKVGDGTF